MKKSLTWFPTGYHKKTNNHEEGWTFLPNGEILTIDCYIGNKYPAVPTNSEVYNPCNESWSSAGSTITVLNSVSDDSGSFDFPDREIGPAPLRSNGEVLAMGALGNSAIYDTCKKSWRVGPTLPVDPTNGQLGCFDSPSAVLPNDNVLLAVCPTNSQFGYGPPLFFFEYNGEQFVPQPVFPNGASEGAFGVFLLVLPTGQILSTDQSGDVEIYTPGNTSFKKKYRPEISECPKSINPGSTYKISGVKFNGMNTGANYGDDYQGSTNYPLVRITNNATNHVFYAITHNHSSMAVASTACVYTYFDVPIGIESGCYTLEVVANGIPSEPFNIQVSGSNPCVQNTVQAQIVKPANVLNKPTIEVKKIIMSMIEQCRSKGKSETISNMLAKK
jgi:hypothetical protein